MPKFIIGRDYGYSGTSSTEEVDCDTIEEAQEIAWEFALENVESWAELAKVEADT